MTKTMNIMKTTIHMRLSRKCLLRETEKFQGPFSNHILMKLFCCSQFHWVNHNLQPGFFSLIPSIVLKTATDKSSEQLVFLKKTKGRDF